MRFWLWNDGRTHLTYMLGSSAAEWIIAGTLPVERTAFVVEEDRERAIDAHVRIDLIPSMIARSRGYLCVCQ